MSSHTPIRVLERFYKLLVIEAKSNGRSAIKQLEHILKERYEG